MGENTKPRDIILEKLMDRWARNRSWAHAPYDGVRLAGIARDLADLINEGATSSIGAQGPGFDDLLLDMAGRLVAWAEMRLEKRFTDLDSIDRLRLGNEFSRDLSEVVWCRGDDAG